MQSADVFDYIGLSGGMKKENGKYEMLNALEKEEGVVLVETDIMINE